MNKESINLNEKFLGKSGVGITYKNLINRLPNSLLDKFQIIIDHTDHFVPLNYEKIRLYWAHLTPKQNEEVARIVNSNQKPLANGGWRKFHKIIFVSYQQMESWVEEYNIPRSHCTVIKNAIEPIEIREKPKNKIKVIYHCSPQKGLSLLVDTFEKLCEEYSNLELNIYSSYKIYTDDNHFLKNFDRKQKEYEKSELYERLEKNPKINNLGFISNEELRKSLASSHIFAYPNILQETFCISLVEAMSAKCLCVHPNYGCLPEISSNWTMMYDFNEKIIFHKEIFYKNFKEAIEIINKKELQEHLEKQKDYIDYFFNWNKKSEEWIKLLESLKSLSPKKIKKTMSVYY